MRSVRTKPSKQHVLVSTVLFWQDAGSDELQLAAAARVPSMPAGLPVPQGLTIRPATTELAASALALNTIGVNIFQRRSSRSPEAGGVAGRPEGGYRVWGSYARGTRNM